MGDVIAWSKLKKLTKLTKKTIDDVSNDIDALAVEGQRSGVPAPNMKVFNAESKTGGIELTYAANVGTSLGGKTPTGDYDYTLASLTKGVMIRYSKVGYPKTINDGTLLTDDKELFSTTKNGSLEPVKKTKFVDGLTLENEYYFSAFPYSNHGIINDLLGAENTERCVYTDKCSLKVSVSADVEVKPLVYTLTIDGEGNKYTKQGTGAGEYTFNKLQGGNYTVTVSAVNGYNTPQAQTINVTNGTSVSTNIEYACNATFQASTWSEIDKIAKSGQAHRIFNIGDEKQVVVNGETITLQIYGFNHDQLTDGGLAGITLGMKDCLNTERRMNPTNSNAGGFAKSELCSWLNGSFYESLPEDLKSVIKKTRKKTAGGNDSPKVINENLFIFLFAEVEVQGNTIFSYQGEGYQYPIFATQKSRVKKVNGVNKAWWLRSRQQSGHVVSICYIKDTGEAWGAPAHTSFGVVGGFCV